MYNRICKILPFLNKTDHQAPKKPLCEIHFRVQTLGHKHSAVVAEHMGLLYQKRWIPNASARRPRWVRPNELEWFAHEPSHAMLEELPNAAVDWAHLTRTPMSIIISSEHQAPLIPDLGDEKFTAAAVLEEALTPTLLDRLPDEAVVNSLCSEFCEILSPDKPRDQIWREAEEKGAANLLCRVFWTKDEFEREAKHAPLFGRFLEIAYFRGLSRQSIEKADVLSCRPDQLETETVILVEVAPGPDQPGRDRAEEAARTICMGAESAGGHASAGWIDSARLQIRVHAAIADDISEELMKLMQWSMENSIPISSLSRPRPKSPLSTSEDKPLIACSDLWVWPPEEDEEYDEEEEGNWE